MPQLEGAGRAGGVGGRIYLVAPELASAALPYLVLAICPISMLLLMGAMNHGGDGKRRDSPEVGNDPTREEQTVRLREHEADLVDQIRALEQDEQPATRDAVARRAHDSGRGRRRRSRLGCRSKA